MTQQGNKCLIPMCDNLKGKNKDDPLEVMGSLIQTNPFSSFS